MTTNTNLLALLQSQINAVSAATPLNDLVKLSVSSSGKDLNTTALDAELELRRTAATGATSLDDLTRLSISIRQDRSYPMIGQVVRFPPSFPVLHEDGGRYFVRNGFSVAAGYHPDLEHRKHVITGYSRIALPNSAGADFKDVIKFKQYVIAGGVSGYIARSTDGGVTFNMVALPSNLYAVSRFAVNESGVIMACLFSYPYMLVSTDFGATWTAKALPAGQYLDVVATDTGFVAIPYEISSSTANRQPIVSTDNGNTWSVATVNLAPGTYPMVRAACSQGVICIALSFSDNTDIRVLRSVNGGFNWEFVLSTSGSLPKPETISGAGRNWFVGRNSSSNPSYASTDYGQTWVPIVGFENSWHSAIIGQKLFTAYSTLVRQTYLDRTAGADPRVSTAYTTPIGNGEDVRSLRSCDGYLLGLARYSSGSTCYLITSNNAVGLDMQTAQGDDADSYYMRVL